MTAAHDPEVERMFRLYTSAQILSLPPARKQAAPIPQKTPLTTEKAPDRRLQVHREYLLRQKID